MSSMMLEVDLNVVKDYANRCTIQSQVRGNVCFYAMLNVSMKKKNTIGVHDALWTLPKHYQGRKPNM